MPNDLEQYLEAIKRAEEQSEERPILTDGRIEPVEDGDADDGRIPEAEYTAEQQEEDFGTGPLEGELDDDDFSDILDVSDEDITGEPSRPRTATVRRRVPRRRAFQPTEPALRGLL